MPPPKPLYPPRRRLSRPNKSSHFCTAAPHHSSALSRSKLWRMFIYWTHNASHHSPPQLYTSTNTLTIQLQTFIFTCIILAWVDDCRLSPSTSAWLTGLYKDCISLNPLLFVTLFALQPSTWQLIKVLLQVKRWRPDWLSVQMEQLQSWCDKVTQSTRGTDWSKTRRGK